MSLLFNFNAKYPVPAITKIKYKYAPFDGRVASLKVNGIKITINIEKEITAAWGYLEDHCAKLRQCNNYFMALAGKQTLAAWMEQTFVVHLLTPKGHYTEEDLPQANSAGHDIGISYHGLADTRGHPAALAATLLHEIAHTAGATTDASAINALQAENALTHCGLRRYFDKENRG